MDSVKLDYLEKRLFGDEPLEQTQESIQKESELKENEDERALSDKN